MNPDLTDNSLDPVQFDVAGERCSSSSPVTSVIMHSRGRADLCKIAIQSLVNTCTNVDEVEILMKVDSDDPQIPQYLDILRATPFHHKLLTYDRLDAYWSIPVFQNDLSRLANGSVLWCFNEDNEIVSGDWVRAFRETRDVYSDNIYVVQVPGAPPRSHKTAAPAYSKEWFNVLGIISPHIYSDRFLTNMAKIVGRFLTSDEVQKIQFRHRHAEKISRPPINLGHESMISILRNQISSLRPRFESATEN